MAENSERITNNNESLQDIPLAEIKGTKDRSFESIDEERKTKTNSLKKFFRLTKIKGQNIVEEDNGMIVEKSNSQEAQGKCQSEGEEDVDAFSKDGRNTLRTRFKLRLGGLQHHTWSSRGVDNLSKPELAGAQSKSTLKSSISTYFNNVFKKDNPKKTTDDKGNISTTNSGLESSPENIKIEDDVQALKISQEK